MTRGYAPREPHRVLIHTLARLCDANHSDRCIVSIDKLRELCGAWFHVHRSRRWVCYHLKAAEREQLLARQTRWRKLPSGEITKGRTRYRLRWRQVSRWLSHARHALRWLSLPTLRGRQEVVQKIAFGLQNLLDSIVPQAP